MPGKDDLILMLIVGVLVVAGAIMGYRMADPPRLVGYGCAGSAGPLYADEEDHFPPCDSIAAR